MHGHKPTIPHAKQKKKVKHTHTDTQINKPTSYIPTDTYNKETKGYVLRKSIPASRTDLGARWFSSIVVRFLFLAFQAWYTFRRRWNSLRQAWGSRSQEVLMVSLNSAYFHLLRSYFLLAASMRCFSTMEDLHGRDVGMEMEMSP
ncbi:hypothetical protein E2C01_022135 [Portunus trituberculatus]|uniref:Uncharacterized protein n=1 Tax=Portunus trituberculatus TaxID=210409 RepID=A0A5B7E673_PORTR|nr:hypothetical protein [Portunus trituberculatus]